MEAFKYQARDSAFDFSEGKIEAETIEAAAEQVRQMGLVPLWLWPVKPKSRKGGEYYSLPTWRLVRDDGMVLEYAASRTAILFGLFPILIGAGLITLFALFSPGGILGWIFWVFWIPFVLTACLIVLAGIALLLLKGKMKVDRVTGELVQTMKIGPFSIESLAVRKSEVTGVIISGRMELKGDEKEGFTEGCVFDVSLKKGDGSCISIDSSSSARTQYEMGRKIAEYFDLSLSITQ